MRGKENEALGLGYRDSGLGKLCKLRLLYTLSLARRAQNQRRKSLRLPSLNP